MSADVTPYTGLITSEHSNKPNFMATIAGSVQPFADQTATLNGMNVAFDLDSAVGAQLDVIGRLVGASRTISGFVLSDAALLLFIHATIAANSWDGTIPGAYAAWQALGYQLIVIDHQDMTFDLALVGAAPDAETLALIQGGYLSLRPAGVGVRDYIVPTMPTVAPLFGFGVESQYIAGFSVGGFADFLPGS